MQFTNWHEMRANKWVPNNGANEWKMSEKRWIIRKMTDKRCGARMRLPRSAELNWIIKQPANDSADACFLVMNSRKIKFIHHNFHQSSCEQPVAASSANWLPSSSKLSERKNEMELSISGNWWGAISFASVLIGTLAFSGPWDNWIVEHNVHVERFP